MIRCPTCHRLLLLILVGEEGQRLWATAYRCHDGYYQVSIVRIPLTELILEDYE